MEHEMLAVCRLDPRDLDQSLDKYLLYFDDIRDNLLSLLITTPESLSLYLWNPEYSPLIDRHCQCDVGLNVDVVAMSEKREYTKIFNRIISRNNRCAQCSLFHRLMKDGQGHNEIIIKDNGKIEKTYILDRYDSLSLIMKWKKYNKIHNTTNTINRHNELQYIGFLILDYFTCSILSNWYIEAALESWGIPGSVRVETGYVCSNNGYIMRTKSSLSSWSSISESYLNNDKYDNHPLIIISLWVQLFSILQVLSKYNFDYPSFSTENIHLQFNKVFYNYDGIEIDNNAMIQLYFRDGCDIDVYLEGVSQRCPPQAISSRSPGCDDLRSSLAGSFFETTLETETETEVGKEKYRIYKNNKIDLILDKKPFSLTTRNINYVNCSQDDFCISTKQCYIQVNEDQFSSYLKKDKSIPNIKENISLYKRYIDYGLIPGSVVTVYMCILTMMIDIHTYRTVMEDDELYNFWEGLWHPLEFDSIHSQIKNMVPSKEAITSDDLLKIIILSRLRCDVADFVWESIKNIYNMNIK